MAVSPFMGGIIDYFGRRTWWLVIGCTLLFPVFSIFAFGGDAVDPYAPMVILGIGYSIVAAALWPSIALVVPGTVVGTANGIATSVQMLGVGICNLATGAIVDAAGYPALMKMFLGFACVATLGGETARSSLSRARKHSPACPAISVTLMDKDGKLKESKKEREHRTAHSSSAALRCVF